MFNLKPLSLAALLFSGFTASSTLADEPLAQEKRIAVTGCAVMFATKSAGRSATHAGLFTRPMAGQGRLDADVKKTYTLEGVDAQTMQAITDQLCQKTRESITAHGYQDATADFQSNAHFGQYAASGFDSGKTIKAAGTQYLLLAPSGQRVTLGTPENDGRFNWVAGYMPQYEAGILTEIKSRGMRIVYIVDFADIDAKKSKGIGNKLFGQTTAEVDAKINFSVSASLFFYDPQGLKCYEYDGKHICTFMGDADKYGLLYTPDAPYLSEDVVVSVEDTTTKGKKTMNAVGNTVAVVGALADFGGMSIAHVSDWTVTVDLEKFKARATEGAQTQLDNVFVYIEQNPTLRAKKK